MFISLVMYASRKCRLNCNLGAIKFMTIQENGQKPNVKLYGGCNYTYNQMPCIVFCNLFKAIRHYNSHMWYLCFEINHQI